MLHSLLRLLPLAGLALLTACATTPTGTEVSRNYLSEAIPAADVINIEPADESKADSLEFEIYANAVGEALTAAGFTFAEGNDADLVALVNVFRGLRELPPKPSRFSIGVGGGSYGGNVGVGGGVNMPVGGSSGGQVNINEITIKIVRRSTKSIVWEGRATRQGDIGAASPTETIRQMTAMLLEDFPGQTGTTVVADSPAAD